MLLRECFRHLHSLERKRIPAQDCVMRLHRGERPDPLPAALLAVISDNMADYVWNELQEYPHYPPFYARLADHLVRYEGAPRTLPINPAEFICVGAGIEEFIRTLMFLSCEPGERAFVLYPTCAMYDIYAAAFGVNLIRHHTWPSDLPSVDDIISSLQVHERNLRVVFIPNPGQPVETYYRREELYAIAKWCAARDIVLAIDEAHHGFGAQSAIPLVWDFPNVLVMRTFSKFFAAAGARVGYVVGHPWLIKSLHGVRPSGEITGPSMLIASVLLQNYQDVLKSAVETAHARNWLRLTINGSGWHARAYGEWGFSTLIEFEDAALAYVIETYLRQWGIYVKSGFAHPLNRHLLVANGSRALMEQFYAQLQAAYQTCAAVTA